MTAKAARQLTLAVACGVLAFAVTVRALEREPAAPKAPRLLSETGLFLSDGTTIDPRNRPFAPQYPLWTDGAAKRRWIQLPAGATIDASNADEWNFPVGTRFWKEFAFNGHKVETRLLWHARPGRWVFASYAWNDAQTDATLVPADGLANAAEVAPGKFHNIPSIDQCQSCHVSGRPRILGFDALQLSDDRDPNALHADRLTPEMITLKTLIAERKITPARQGWIARPPRIEADDARSRTALGYLSANCGSCHNRQSTIASLGLWLKQRTTVACSDALASTVDRRGHWVVPTAPDDSRIINPGHPELSALIARVSSRRPLSQMPAIGSAIVDTEAVNLLSDWIRAMIGTPRLERPCAGISSRHSPSPF